MSLPAVVRPAMAPSSTAAHRAGEESTEEGVELGHAVLWDINGDRFVLRGGRDFPIHVYSYHCLRKLA
jgi:hypothetical protein